MPSIQASQDPPRRQTAEKKLTIQKYKTHAKTMQPKQNSRDTTKN